MEEPLNTSMRFIAEITTSSVVSIIPDVAKAARSNDYSIRSPRHQKQSSVACAGSQVAGQIPGCNDFGPALLHVLALAVKLGPGFQEMDNVKNATRLLPAILALILSGYSGADELTDAAEGLCSTIKTCALEAVAGPGLSDELRQQMEPLLERNCADMRSRVLAVSASNSLYQPAVGCLRSMASLSCNLLHNMGEIKTAECAEYERLLKATSAVPQ